MKIGARIRMLREQQHMSQEALAEKMNVSRQAVTKWEADQSMPSTSNLLELCKLFGVSLDELTNNRQSCVGAMLDQAPLKKKKERFRLLALVIANCLMLLGTLWVYGMERDNTMPMNVIGYAQGPTNIWVLGTPVYVYILFGATLVVTMVTIIWVVKWVKSKGE